MKLEPLTTGQISPEGSVVYEVSTAVGMCRKKCLTCKCLQRILNGCSAVGITVPPYDHTEAYPTPIFLMTDEQLKSLHEHVLKEPEPEVW